MISCSALFFLFFFCLVFFSPQSLCDGRGHFCGYEERSVYLVVVWPPASLPVTRDAIASCGSSIRDLCSGAIITLPPSSAKNRHPLSLGGLGGQAEGLPRRKLAAGGALVFDWERVVGEGGLPTSLMPGWLADCLSGCLAC